MFVASLGALRKEVPTLSGALADPAAVAAKLEGMPGVAALEGERLIGYLTSWHPIERFRDANRTGAYAPEWAHGAAGDAGRRTAIYRALYRAASTQWTETGCDLHAITLLAGDDATVKAWFWSGFGMGTVDVVRPMTPLDLPALTGYGVRAATADDGPALSALDAEHNRHYVEPPVFMAPRASYDAAAWSAFLERPGNSAWIAEDAGGPFGFIRFDREFGGADVVETGEGIFISGAYVRASHRGRGAAPAILGAALRHYAALGLGCCALDFEAFNPEAAAFWPRYFTPVCFSLMRAPEWV